MAWNPISPVVRRVASYRNGIRGFRTEDQPTNAILYADDINPVYDHLDTLTDAVNLAGETAVVGNESLGALGDVGAARGTILVRGETAYEGMPPGNSLQVPHWNSNVPRGMEPVTLLESEPQVIPLLTGYTTPAGGEPLRFRFEGRQTGRLYGDIKTPSSSAPTQYVVELTADMRPAVALSGSLASPRSGSAGATLTSGIYALGLDGRLYVSTAGGASYEWRIHITYPLASPRP